MKLKNYHTKDGKHPRHFVKEWRLHRGFTQKQLAAKIGYTEGNLSQLESGRIEYRQPILEALAVALACGPADLLREPETFDPETFEMMQMVRQLDVRDKKLLLKIMAVVEEHWPKDESPEAN